MPLPKEDVAAYIPRFSFEITEEQKSRANKLLSTHGVRKAIFNPILDDVLDMIEEHGQIVVGVLLEEGVKPREVIKSMNKAERRAKR